MPVDQLLTFSCALHQMRRALDHPAWARQGPAWRTSAHAAKLELSSFQQQRPELFARLPAFANRAAVPFDISTATDLALLDADFREQTTARRRDRDSARFAVPFVAIALDVRTLEYAVLIIMMLALIEAAIFHHSLLLTPGCADAPRRSFYFKTLTALSRQQEQPPAAAQGMVERAAQVLSAPARWTVLALLWLGAWAPFFGHLHWGGARPGAVADGFALCALAAINTSLVLWNLRQLTQLEAVPRVASQSRDP